MNKQNILYVCWKYPENFPENNVILLSFLNPAAEEKLKNDFTGTVVSARKIAQEVKDKARTTYIDLIAKVGATPVNEGKTFRQALKRKDGISLWWFHKVSEKNCESDPTFNSIIEILVIISVADTANIKEIVLFGGYKEIADILNCFYEVKTIQCKKRNDFYCAFLKGIGSRVKYFFIFLVRWFAIKRTVKKCNQSIDVVFSGFWDWSVKEDKETYELIDRFFKSLPDKLSSIGLKVGWFLWFDPYFEPISKGRKLKHILDPISRYDNLIMLQQFIKVSDLIKALLNIKPCLIFFSFCRRNDFKKGFIVNRINFFPLLQSQLLYGFLNSSIPHHELVLAANSRAFEKYQPKVSFSFLELFLYSRALYSGKSQGSYNTIHYAIQHGSYSKEKTFILLDPDIEYSGYPDNCPVPKPDYVFAMGELGKEIFMESGFPAENIFLTGSTRYEHIKNNSIIHNVELRKIKNLLIVPSMDMKLEIEMIEAVYIATKNLPQIKLFLRNHPFAKMSDHPEFVKFHERIEFTSGNLDEDLEKADIVIFSYSTVAEEALIKGIPIWQWVSTSYNGSVFRDLKVIPSFYSIFDLRVSLKRFISNPEMFIPNEEIRKYVLKKCFCAGDKKISSDRIADIVVSNL